jgi:3-hydroxyisobutyrate dehydrogenase-like beta-hydroxyacid dehydrogenase
MIFSTIEQLSEVFTLNEKAGISPETVFEVLTNSFCSAPIHKNYGRMILDAAFSPPGGAMELGMKDNKLMLEAGEEFGVPLPIASLLRDRFIASVARGDGELDFAALSKRAREDGGLT